MLFVLWITQIPTFPFPVCRLCRITRVAGRGRGPLSTDSLSPTITETPVLNNILLFYLENYRAGPTLRRPGVHTWAPSQPLPLPKRCCSSHSSTAMKFLHCFTPAPLNISLLHGKSISDWKVLPFFCPGLRFDHLPLQFVCFSAAQLSACCFRLLLKLHLFQLLFPSFSMNFTPMLFLCFLTLPHVLTIQKLFFLWKKLYTKTTQ